MKAIVAVDKKWGIGKNNGLLFSLKEDMRFFRLTTTGKTVVMGSNTLKSFPGGSPLKNRNNIVLYPGGEKRDDCLVVNSPEELFSVLKSLDGDEVFVIGGAMMYKTLLPYCDTVFVTKVNADGDATVFFENLDEHPDFCCVFEGEPLSDNGYEIRFTTYKNNAPRVIGG